MFIIRGSAQKLKFVKKLLEKEGLHVEDTIMPDYILTVRDPTEYIPEDYKTHIKIAPLDNSYVSILKNTGVIKDMIMSKGKCDVGNVVKINNGKYSGFTGIIAEIEDKFCTIEISVFGKIVKDTVNISDFEVHDNPFR